MSDKLKKAECLLDEIGEIDDDLLAEAMAYRPARRAPRFVLIAACLGLSIIFTVSSVVMLQRLSSGFGDKYNNAQADTPTHAPIENPPADSKGPKSLDAVFTDARGKGHTMLSSESEIPYRDGNAYIVWQYAGDEEFYLADMTSAELTELEKKLGYGRSVGQTSPELECMVWIVTGDGAVISPYLKDTYGNIGISVFDYCAEIYPTQDFINYISAMIQ